MWGSSLPELYERIRVIAARCSELNIALSKKKFVIGNEISFAGLLLTEKGVKPDPARISALSEFPRPKDVTGEMVWAKPKPARKVVKIRALKGLKDMVV